MFRPVQHSISHPPPPPKKNRIIAKSPAYHLYKNRCMSLLLSCNTYRCILLLLFFFHKKQMNRQQENITVRNKINVFYNEQVFENKKTSLSQAKPMSFMIHNCIPWGTGGVDHLERSCSNEYKIAYFAIKAKWGYDHTKSTVSSVLSIISKSLLYILSQLICV